MAGTDRENRWMQAIRTDRVWQLMIVNLAVFIVLHALAFFGVSMSTVATLCVLPSLPDHFVRCPWTLLTYMFSQWDVFQLIFNMLWLWTFGLILTRMDEEQRRTVKAYVIGGLTAAVVWLALGAVDVENGGLVGSSAAVLSVIGYGGVKLGRCSVQLMLFGNCQVRWMALVIIALCLLTDAGAQSATTVAVHASGAIAGALYALAVKHGVGRARGYSRKPAGYARQRRPYTRGLDATEQAQLDALLDKVKRGGYAALAPAEKTLLYQLSQKIR